MEHRLVGTGRDDLTQYSSSEQEPVSETRAVPGTLLGPEGPGITLDLSDDDPTWSHQVRGVSRGPTPRMNHSPARRTGTEHRVDLRPYLENCTVDASIFVAKLIRAHGGCLGTRSRRRT